MFFGLNFWGSCAWYIIHYLKKWFILSSITIGVPCEDALSGWQLGMFSEVVKKWLIRNIFQKREVWYCDWSACCFVLESWNLIKLKKVLFLCVFSSRNSVCYSFVLSVTELPWGELRTAFKFKRTTASCSFRSPEAWPKTRKGCLARALCQRFNIWILLQE